MGRPVGSRVRENPKDRVKYLRRWLKRAKERLARRDGCLVCGCDDPSALMFTWVVEPGEGGRFPIGNGPFRKGMTLVKLREAVRSAALICRRRCAKGALKRGLQC